MVFGARNNNWLVIYQDRDYDCIYRWDDDCDRDITGSMVKRCLTKLTKTTGFEMMKNDTDI